MEVPLFRNKRLQKAQSNTNVELVETPWNRLNKRQKSSVEDRNSIRVVAGGTGKTAVLTARVAFLISELSVNPYHILTLTFTNRAAREMHRINEIVGDESVSSQITMGTFHATCLSILRKDIEKISFLMATPICLEIPTGLGSECMMNTTQRKQCLPLLKFWAGKDQSILLASIIQRFQH